MNRKRSHLRGDTVNARFERAVEESFAFLVRHYGFDQLDCQTRDSDAWVVYMKYEATVRVSREHASGCRVSLTEPIPTQILYREFDLDELAEEMAAAGRYTPKPSAALTIEESVAHCAEVLLTIGAEVLNGDFGMLVARERRRQA